MSYHHCPKCGSFSSWSLRRNSRRCKKCRKEWTPSLQLVPGIRGGSTEWRKFLRAFLRYRTVQAVRLHTHQSHPLVIKMSRIVRMCMAHDVPNMLSGTVEVDETYIGPQWRNRRWKIRKHGTKKGRGTFKQAVFGIYERKRMIAKTFLVPNVQKKTLLGLIQMHVEKGSIVYSDGYQAYQHASKFGYTHDWVDHDQNEFGRDEVHTNGMEGFWGILKRRLKITGGIRMSRLHEYVAEETWRYNYRKLSEKEKIDRLINILKKFGG